MAGRYNVRMREAAFRHNEAAEALPADRKDVAGYLFGLAVECAMKQLMITLGVPGAQEPRGPTNPYFAHFATLKTLLRDDEHARRHKDLRKFTEKASFMQDWDVAMRYSDGKAVTQALADRWRQDAKDILQEI
jgi:hypothetical protein